MDREELVLTINALQRRLGTGAEFLDGRPGRGVGRVVGFVPTMGALHDGHLSLIRQARRDCDVVAISIFVNPLQFGPGEDFDIYPRDLDEDTAMAVDSGADIVFAPSVEEIYPEEIVAKVSVNGLGDVLCGRYRPGHFTGVATVVTKLLNVVRPDKAYFGAKDWQQFVVVGRVVNDLNMGVEIISVPTVRDADGLALSSRNRYLTAEERRWALALPAAIEAAAEAVRSGERDAAKVIGAAKEVIAAGPGVKLEYFSVCRPGDLQDVAIIEGDVLLAAAVYVGKTRLIDNMVIKL